MSRAPSFTADQPKDGDTILHCGHFGGSFKCYWFKFADPVGFVRPDRSCGDAEWFVACEACFVKHGEEASNFPRGDGVWTGDEPAVEKEEEN